jgi:lipopolysaccharide transport system ATP-binding protein
MSNTVISIENLSKAYRLGQIGTGALKDDLKVWWAKKRGQPNPLLTIGQQDHGNRHGETLWALQDISFAVQEGDVLGIIGRNGAGKSTLLKILSRVTAPTVGHVRVKGRIASLLEVGTGFHPDLTGRENIYLNGAILGMNRKETARKFDEIVAFSEIEQFIDTPVKRYSSGMYVRLAFAVAAHLDPEILIVDEVLAVGDAEFQKKCIGKMKDVSVEGGRTVLFVSHNTAAVRALCTSCIYLANGRLRAQGPVNEIVSEYLRPVVAREESATVRSRHGIELFEARLVPKSDLKSSRPIHFDEPCELRIRIGADEPQASVAVVVRIHDEAGALVSSVCSPEEGIAPFVLGTQHTVRFDIPRMLLMPGRYFVSVFVFRPNDSTAYLEADGFTKFEVLPAVVRGGMWAYEHHHGLVRISDGGVLE